MSMYTKALLWAVTMLLVAAGIRFDLVAAQPATTVLLLMPLLFVLAVRKARCVREAK